MRCTYIHVLSATGLEAKSTTYFPYIQYAYWDVLLPLFNWYMHGGHDYFALTAGTLAFLSVRLIFCIPRLLELYFRFSNVYFPTICRLK